MEDASSVPYPPLPPRTIPPPPPPPPPPPTNFSLNSSLASSRSSSLGAPKPSDPSDVVVYVALKTPMDGICAVVRSIAPIMLGLGILGIFSVFSLVSSTLLIVQGALWLVVTTSSQKLASETKLFGTPGADECLGKVGGCCGSMASRIRNVAISAIVFSIFECGAAVAGLIGAIQQGQRFEVSSNFNLPCIALSGNYGPVICNFFGSTQMQTVVWTLATTGFALGLCATNISLSVFSLYATTIMKAFFHQPASSKDLVSVPSSVV